MSNPPPNYSSSSSSPSRTKDFLSSPALSLSLAGIFRDAREVEDVDNKSTTVEISSDDHQSNSEPARSKSKSKSEENTTIIEEEDDDDDDDVDNNNNNNNKKKRKKYHRHTTNQIRQMEALFKESPHPDEKQREELSNRLGLAPRQVKFWFQNRRTQIKAIQERHENSLFKSELDKLREENKALRETINNLCCPNCGFHNTTTITSTTLSEEQQLRIENAKLKLEMEKLRATIGKHQTGATPSGSSSQVNDQENNRSSLDFYSGIFGLVDKSNIKKIANQALEELKIMASAGEPLWIRSLETGREILNYDEYMKECCSVGQLPLKRSIEASRETGVVFVEIRRLVESFMDVNQWKEMFPCLISKAATVDVICQGEGQSRNGALQLMFAEVQMLTPMVATREVYFVRFCKQLSSEEWAIVDVSIDIDIDNNNKLEDNASLVKCRKRPSGCIIQDKSNGHCKVTWIEHLECMKTTIHSMYRTIVYSGLAFGARHWIATLQQQCERLVFFMAINVPTKDSTGVATLAGRKSILNLAQRMTTSFCRFVGASSNHTWNKVSSKSGEDIRVGSRKNLNDPGEPLGVILCAVSSVWLPVPPYVLFDFLRDEAHRNEWDLMSNGDTVQSIANLAKGQDRGNAVTIQTMKSKENSMWILQDSCTNAFESMVVFAPVDIPGMQSVITGCHSGNLAILPSGFSILPDGVDSRPLVISLRQREKSSEGGSLLTIAFQILINSSDTAKLSIETVESVDTLISCTLRNIKTSLQCEDG
ncbi:hypothetical protein ACFE04_003970 [Oxalis oulophora]